MSRPVTEKLMLRAMVPPHFHAASLKFIKEPGAKKLAKKLVGSVCDKMLAGEIVVLMGQFCTGKTSLATMMLKAVLRAGHTALFLAYSDIRRVFFEAVDVRVPPEVLRESPTVRERLRRVDALLLDDFGSVAFKKDSESMAAVESILRDRYNQKRGIILTTNLSPDELKEGFTESIYSLLRRSGNLVHVSSAQWKPK